MWSKLLGTKKGCLGVGTLMVFVLVCMASFTCLTYSKDPTRLFHILVESFLWQCLLTGISFAGIVFVQEWLFGENIYKHKKRVRILSLILVSLLTLPLLAWMFSRPIDGFDIVFSLIINIIGGSLVVLLFDDRSQEGPEQPPRPSPRHPTPSPSAIVPQKETPSVEIQVEPTITPPSVVPQSSMIEVEKKVVVRSR